MLINADCSEYLKTLEKNSIDSLVTDPPAGISFMGKEWDKDDNFIESMTDIYKECLRVLKPGAHGLVWAIPRTSHWTATALENAGFEIRDVITHIFGSGFPKSLDVSKAIDKMYGAEREVVGSKNCGLHHRGGSNSFTDDNWKAENRDGDFVPITTPSTSEAKQWEGWGTGLKPASEHWILVRKPLSENTVAKNVLKHGTGGLNIDESRIGFASEKDRKSAIFGTQPKITSKGAGSEGGTFQGYSQGVNARNVEPNAQGRFPANLVLSHNEDCDEQCTEGCAVKMLDDQSGINASRFFYIAKASKRDKEEGLEGMPYYRSQSDFRKDGFGGNRSDPDNYTFTKNHHPTVKNTKLMEYLIRLITPPSGVVLDPFMGSGSTGVAAKRLGFGFVGIEKDPEYFEIAKVRINGKILCTL